MEDLEKLRIKIDEIDDEIVDLLGERFQVVGEVRRVKKKTGIETYHPTREKDILGRIEKRGEKFGLNKLLLHALFLQIFAVSKRQQDNKE
jgi:chorismate mutase / prephenate dehydratase